MGVRERLTGVLEGEIVRLEPLAWCHEEGLFWAAEEEEIWRWMQYGAARGREPFRRWIGAAISNAAAGRVGRGRGGGVSAVASVGAPPLWGAFWARERRRHKQLGGRDGGRVRYPRRQD